MQNQKIKINFLDEEFNLVIDNEESFIESFDKLKNLSDSLKSNAPSMTNTQILSLLIYRIINMKKSIKV